MNTIHKFLSFIAENNETDIITSPITNITNTTNPIDIPIKTNSRGLWLLFLDLFIFGFLTMTTYNSSKKINSQNQEVNNDFRPQFIKWLVIANGIRTVSLLFIIAFGNPNGDNALSWLNSVLHVGPAFLFVSSYMYFATFLADLYYQGIQMNVYWLKPLLKIFVSGGYLFLFLLALITLIFRGYSAFYYISEFLMALLYLLLGSITIFYGRKVSEIFDSKSTNKFESSSNEMYNKLSILSNSIGGLFLLKGLSGILSGFGYITKEDDYHNIYDFFWFLILEIAPTAIFILVGKKKETIPISDTPRQSSVYEMDYSTTEQRENSSYRPPFVK